MGSWFSVSNREGRKILHDVAACLRGATDELGHSTVLTSFSGLILGIHNLSK